MDPSVSVARGRRPASPTPVPALVALLVAVAACTGDNPPASPWSWPDLAERTFEERLGDASSGAVRVQRGEGGEVQFVVGRIPVPAHVAADPESRARWFLEEYGDEVGVGDPASDVTTREVVEAEAGTPEEGDAVVVFDRTEGGVPVFGGEVRVEVTRDSEVTVVIARGPDDTASVPTTPRFTEAEAVAASLAAHPGATVRRAQLLILNEGLFTGVRTASRLAWRVDLSAGLLDAPVRFVDALDGRLLPFRTTNVIEARDRHTFTHRAMCGDAEQVFAESGPVAGTVATSDATSAHAHAATVWDYLWQTFRRDSHDGRGAPVVTHADYREQDRLGDCPRLHNSFWDRETQAMYFGEGEPSLDIVSHEYTHGLVERTARLPYVGQTGALDESFADVFAAFVDTGSRWTIGDGTASGVVRDLRDPNAYCQPAHMDEYAALTPDSPVSSCRESSDCPNVSVPLPGGARCSVHVWFRCIADTCEIAGNDYGGVHTNSGIPNHAAYLMTEGGAGPRDGIEVMGIGREKAEQIHFRALTKYTVSSADFGYFRAAMVIAAFRLAEQGLHEVTHEDCGSVLTALGAVGIGAIDTDRDCWDDVVDNCPTVYNPDQESVDCMDCSARTMCPGCALTDGCGWCRDPGTDGCVRLDGARCGDIVTEAAMCAPSCGGRGVPCPGSGPTFDDACCEDLICVVGGCTDAGCGRERADCADSGDCCFGLQCRRVGSATASPQCCARADDYCEAKEDCCGLMECVSNRCRGRTSGEACLLGDCVGMSFCSDGACT